MHRYVLRFVGQPPFSTDRLYDATPPGVVMGLAWTSLGGVTLYVEALVASLRPEKDGEKDTAPAALRITGQARRARSPS